MAKFREKKNAKGIYEFMCPGCNFLHLVYNAWHGSGNPIWEFNGNLDKPSISPSLKLTANYPGGEHVCHSFIKYGMIQFLNDCTHALKGQTVELPEIDCQHDPVCGGGMITCAKCGEILADY